MTNPLNIPELATIVAGFISKDPSFTVNDLKSIRCLGKTWRKETLGTWRSSAVFLINDETMPFLVEAFQEENAENNKILVGADEEEKDDGNEVARVHDPFELRMMPFKKYRISSSTVDQLWTYPLAMNLIERNFVWEEVICPHAVYLDVGHCFIQRAWGTFKPGLVWILSRCENVRELAITPMQREDDKQLENEIDDRLIESGAAAWMETTTTRECKLSFRNWRIRKLTLSVPETSLQQEEQQGPVVLPLFWQGDERLCIQNECVAHYFIHMMLRGLKVLRFQNGEEASAILKDLSSWCGNAYCYSRPTMLHSLTVLDQNGKNTLSTNYLALYLKNRGSHLQNLRLPLMMQDCMYRSRFWEGLLSVNSKLRNLALDVNCEQEGAGHQYVKESLYLEECYFANLRKFAVRLDYKTFRGKLIQFDLRDLKRMPMLELFHFGTKSNVAKSWATRKLCIDFQKEQNNIKDELEAFNLKNPPYQMLDFDNGGLPHLKWFHFHGNLTNASLLRVASWTKNLETVGMVFDEENISALFDERSWPGLKKLKLLPGSCVPEKDISALEKARPDLQIVDESEQYSPAVEELV